ncbi:hypothetical protein LCGC14_0526500, partial [marine sediment metagenome]
RDFFDRNPEEASWEADNQAMEKLIEFLLKREMEVNPPPEFRKTIDFYFRNSAAELQEAVLGAFWPLLKEWSKQKEH